MKDKINVQEVEFLSHKIDQINKKYLETMSLDEIKANLDTKIKPEVKAYLDNIFKEILNISKSFPYSLTYNFDNNTFDIEIIIDSDYVY